MSPDPSRGGTGLWLLFALLIIGIVLGYSLLASAKPPKVKLTIEGGSLNKPLEIVHGETTPSVTTMRIGDRLIVRDEHGEWHEVKPN